MTTTTTKLDISKWPAEACIAAWTRLTGVSHVTFNRNIKAGRIKGERQLNGMVFITKEEICRHFKIKQK